MSEVQDLIWTTGHDLEVTQVIPDGTTNKIHQQLRHIERDLHCMMVGTKRYYHLGDVYISIDMQRGINALIAAVMRDAKALALARSTFHSSEEGAQDEPVRSPSE